MKRIIALVLAMLLVFSVSAMAEGKLKATEKNLILFDDGETGYFLAKVENVGDEAIGSDDGNLVIFSDDDEIMVTEDYISTLPDYIILAPGEYAYVSEFLWDEALGSAEIGDYKFSIPTAEDGREYAADKCEATYELDEYFSYAYITYTNNGDTDRSLYFAIAMHDAEGNLIYADNEVNEAVLVAPGSTITYRAYIDSSFVEYWDANGIEPAEIEAIAYYRLDD